MKASALFLLMLVAGCSNPQPIVDAIELRMSGSSALGVSIDRRGEATYRESGLSHPGPIRKVQLSPTVYTAVAERLNFLRSMAEPLTEESALALEMRKCPQGRRDDAGAIWVHWIGPTVNDHYLADFTCEVGIQRAWNREVKSTFDELVGDLERLGGRRIRD